MTTPKEEATELVVKKKKLFIFTLSPPLGDGNASFLRLKTLGSREVVNTYSHCVLCKDLKAELSSLN